MLDTTGLGNDADLSWRIGELCKGAPVDILCLSLSCYTDDDEPPLGLAAAIALIQTYGTVVVASAGNDSTCRPAWPAALPDVVSVGCVVERRAGVVHQLRAVGPRLRARRRHRQRLLRRTSTALNPEPTEYGGWASWCGTSFAAPIVAAAIGREIVLYGIEPEDAAERVVDDPRLFRLANLGTVVNLH